MTAWLNVLTGRARKLEDSLTLLSNMQKTWTMTLDAARAANAPESVVRQVQPTLSHLAALQSPVKTQLSAILDLQSRVAHVVTVCEDALIRIAGAQQRIVVGTFVRDSLPIWSSRLWSLAENTALFHIGKMISSLRVEVQNYMTDPPERMPIHAGLIIVLLIVFCAARRQVTTSNDSLSNGRACASANWNATLVIPPSSFSLPPSSSISRVMSVATTSRTCGAKANAV